MTAAELNESLAIRDKEQSIAPVPPQSQEVALDPYKGISSQPFEREQASVLMAPIDDNDVEIRPDGIVFLPEIKYRRRLLTAFGPGAWALFPKSEFRVMGNTMTREYALFVHGRFVSEAMGENDYQANNPQTSWATTSEGVKSNALMRCCKDIGIASELWDPGFIERWKSQYAVEVWVLVHGATKKQWRRKDRKPFWNEKGTVKVKDDPAMQSETQAANEIIRPPATQEEPPIIEVHDAPAVQEPLGPPVCEKCGSRVVFHAEGKWGPWWSCGAWKENNCDWKVSLKTWQKRQQARDPGQEG